MFPGWLTLSRTWSLPTVALYVQERGDAHTDFEQVVMQVMLALPFADDGCVSIKSVHVGDYVCLVSA